MVRGASNEADITPGCAKVTLGKRKNDICASLWMEESAFFLVL